MPVDPSPNHRLLTLSDVEQSAHVLSQAFVDDPLCSFMLPLRRTRRKTLYKFFRAYGEVCIKNNIGYGVGDPLQGVAYWISPNQKGISISVKSLGKFIPLLLSFYPIGYLRAKVVLRQIDTLHKRNAAEPHFYLDNIGVFPSARGRGLSSRLIRPFLELADSQKVSVYTDTEAHSNVAFYEHFGFRCVEECTIPNKGLTIWALRRPIA